ncbi:hypothetical protein ACIP98_32285 [Streptomyces sp. NPDC088354]|uniref:hypothetical protein n=1 Tax=unclassified Streptomyces TaxID=2593676 RepID=UPI0029BC52D8|nr:hypothetical protein [Streptomyces sp. MI02-7b]MDX3077487.1 hypothetical protein [Streptomyces sp. MI02-7b]
MSRPVVAGIGCHGGPAAGPRAAAVPGDGKAGATADATHPDNENSGPRRPPRNGETHHGH